MVCTHVYSTEIRSLTHRELEDKCSEAIQAHDHYVTHNQNLMLNSRVISLLVCIINRSEIHGMYLCVKTSTMESSPTPKDFK